MPQATLPHFLEGSITATPEAEAPQALNASDVPNAPKVPGVLGAQWPLALNAPLAQKA